VSPCHRVTPPLLVLGLGNPILRDDGVGWRVVEEARRIWSDCHVEERQFGNAAVVEFDCVALGGLALMERLVGYERVILVDAICTSQSGSSGGHRVPGAVYRLTLDDLPTLHADSAHDASLKAALELGRRLGAKLPDQIIIYAVEAKDIWDFGETLSPEVEASVAVAAEAVLKALEPRQS